MYKYVLFDLDGTITESGVGIVNSILFALEKLGIREGNKEELKRFIGPPLVNSFIEYYGLDEEKAKMAVSFCQEYLKVKGIYEAPLYEGIEDVLNTLKASGKTLFVATSKPEVFAR